MNGLPSREERRSEAQRLLAGLNGEWVAQRMGERRTTIGMWRNGTRIPDLDDLLRLQPATGRQLSPSLTERLRRYLDFTPGEVLDESDAARAAAKVLLPPPGGETPDDPEEDDPEERLPVGTPAG